MVSSSTPLPEPWPQRPSVLRYALATRAYDSGDVRVVTRDLSCATHFAATRRGLFAINRDGHRLVAHGLFYGITIVDDTIFLFEAGDAPRHPTGRGRIVRLDRAGDTIVGWQVIATGLDNGCHQIDLVRGALHVLDTYHQTIVVMAPDGSDRRVIQPVPMAGDGRGTGYAHINSLVQDDDHTLLLLHNGARDATGPRSEVATFDADWRLVSRTPLDGHGCHNLVRLEDGTLLSCGSLAGELIGTDGRRVRLGAMMTRGLSVDDQAIVVGGSLFAPREGRQETTGAVWFLDRDCKVQAMLAMPAAVSELRRIDGRDRSLSPFVAKEAASHRRARYPR